MRVLSKAGMLTTSIAAMMALIGCDPAQETPLVEAELDAPMVMMEADPLPPFIYWAPENSTIRNHPRLEGVWIAEIEGQPTHYYFGDQCRASELQHLVGQSLDALPGKPADATWRMACSTCAVTSDLIRERMTVSYDDDSRLITSISCG